MDDVRLDLEKLLTDYAPAEQGPTAGEMLIVEGKGIHVEACRPFDGTFRKSSACTGARVCELNERTVKDSVIKELEEARAAGQAILYQVTVSHTRKPLSNWFRMGAAVILRREQDTLVVEKDRYGRLGRRYDGLKSLYVAEERERIRGLPVSSDQILYL